MPMFGSSAFRVIVSSNGPGASFASNCVHDPPAERSRTGLSFCRSSMPTQGVRS